MSENNSLAYKAGREVGKLGKQKERQKTNLQTLEPKS